VHDDLDIVSMVEFPFLVNDDEWDVVPTGVSAKVLRDFIGGAICCDLVGPDVVVIEGLARRGGNMWCLDSFDGGECDVLVLDGVSNEWPGCVWACGDIPQWGFWVGKGIVLAVNGSGVRGLLILQGRVEERSRAIIGEGLQPIVMSRGSVRSIPNHLSQRHFSRYVSV